MSDVLIMLHTAIAILGTVVLILALRVEPLIALLTGSIYLGLATGLGFTGTIEAITSGFGDIMTSIGMLIVFGVLLGSLLSATGALRKLTESLLRVFGAERSPYVFSTTMSSVFPAIYTDVLLVLTAPLGRTIAPRIRRDGTAAMGAALILGSELGLVLVVPGAGALAVAGLLGVPLGQMLLFGLVISVPTALITTFLYKQVLARGMWNQDTDELAPAETPEQEPEEAPAQSGKLPSLGISLLPLLLAIVLIAAGGIAKVAGVSTGPLAFFGDPLIALFLGVIGAYLLAWRSLSRQQAGDTLGNGLRECGSILIITGVGGSLGGVISKTGLEDILAGYFSTNALSPLILAWIIAAVLHVAIGSTSVAAITAGGILAPVLGSIDVAPLLVALAAGSGALFAVHVNSNFFWMFQRLMNLSTRGTLKTCTLVTTMASVVSLALVLLLSLAW
ncbi:H+/gluconate symporter-like permease [Saccharopolyspora lacisalsi]|uniref:H+/gluconate symporter-like permease n=1 Tax=Halosaccharopolyspora lacisalsi TaxID=1000566 RepID=A0A839E247_9PSEU|nr:SLC13 family permease [Halosaccharopolyspora lacisalsi]MBA8825805.1 H+/gluconate symporter-like permease [Halosaccharopolyspora lacisalsi]